MNTIHDNQLPPPKREGTRHSLLVAGAGCVFKEVPEGEFRFGAGRLLFVRRGSRIEIRCPRSKDGQHPMKPQAKPELTPRADMVRQVRFLGTWSGVWATLTELASPLREWTLRLRL